MKTIAIYIVFLEMVVFKFIIKESFQWVLNRKMYNILACIARWYNRVTLYGLTCKSM